jgi:hypothetical protein
MAQGQDKQDLRDQANRLWQHGLHEDSVLNERQNYFLIAESMLLVGYTTVLSTPQPKVFIARVIASFGMLLTLVWIYVNIRQWYIVKHVRARAVEVLPDYRETYQTRAKWHISSIWLLVYLVPAIIGVVWVIFIFAV